MIKIASLLALLGLFLATGVIAWSGAEQVLQALSQAGWGIVWTSLSHIIPMIICVIGWQALLPGRSSIITRERPSRSFFLYVLWLRSSINNLLPVARVGGEIVSVRVMMKYGMRKTSAIACTVVETTLSIIGQFVFVLIGVSFFLFRFSHANLEIQLFLVVLFSILLIAGLLFVQKVGVFGLATKLFTALFRDKWKSFAGNTHRLDQAVKTMYKRRRRALLCLVMQFLSWLAGAGEIWIAMSFLNAPISFTECVMIEALIQATGSAAFIVPGALGVQEAGFLFVGHLLNIPPEVSAALAVMRRCRDLILYIPGLIAWQLQEGKWILQKKKKM